MKETLKVDYPGIGGSLGECVVCGKSFALEIMLGRNVPFASLAAFGDAHLPMHQKCMDEGQGKAPADLPDGPLRRVLMAAIAEEEIAWSRRHEP